MADVPFFLIDEDVPLRSSFVRRSAAFVADLLDSHGNEPQALAQAFRAAATDGLYTFENLRDGLGLLVTSGLAEVNGGVVVPSPALEGLTQSPTGSEALIERLSEPDFAASEAEEARILRAVVGDVGERYVVSRSRSALILRGREDLAEQVLQVSRISDRFGFDVSTPTLSGRNMALEIKATMQMGGSACRFFLSRNEYEVGRHRPESWFLVFCRIQLDRSQLPRNLESLPDLEVAARNAQVHIVGHCRAATLTPWVPEDRNGRWTECIVTLPSHLLDLDLPPLSGE